jgi:hypothetical protein
MVGLVEGAALGDVALSFQLLMFGELPTVKSKNHWTVVFFCSSHDEDVGEEIFFG